MATTGNNAELKDRIRIVRAAKPGAERTVVLTLGSKVGELRLAEIGPGDRMRLFVELEVTTDYEDPGASGLVGSAYSYAPRVEATLLVAKDATATEPKPGRAVRVGDSWRGEISHDHHHAVITFGDRGVNADDLDWQGPYFINVALSAAHPEAGPKDVLLVGQNEPTPNVVTDMAGVRALRLRPGSQAAVAAQTVKRPRVSSIPLNETDVVVFSYRLERLQAGEQLLVKGRVVNDAARLGHKARISTRMFLAEKETQTMPGGVAQQVASWKGHLSKPNGFNCLPEDGPRPSQKFGVARINKQPGKPLYVNLVAVSGDPDKVAKRGAALPVGAGSFLEVTRFSSEREG